jgi:hypothetical protein
MRPHSRQYSYFLYPNKQYIVVLESLAAILQSFGLAKQRHDHLERKVNLYEFWSNPTRLFRRVYHGRVYLIDKEFNVVSYELLLSVLEYKTMVVRRDMEAAASILPSIPKDHHNKIARFLEGIHHSIVCLISA